MSCGCGCGCEFQLLMHSHLLLVPMLLLQSCCFRPSCGVVGREA